MKIYIPNEEVGFHKRSCLKSLDSSRVSNISADYLKEQIVISRITSWNHNLDFSNIQRAVFQRNHILTEIDPK